MIERQRQSRFGRRTARRATPPLQDWDVPPDRTVPGIPPPRLVAAEEPTILGFPVDEEPAADEPTPVPGRWAPPEGALEPPLRLVAVPRADPLAGIALVLAGIAAAVSLWLPWRRDQTDTGGALTREGLAAAGAGLMDLGRSGVWQPVAIVLGGGLLLLLGVLLFLPARTHRIVGVLALLVAAAATAGVIFRIAQLGWIADRFGPGLWFAVAVAALGILGALKAMLTVPRVAVRSGYARR